MKRRTLSRSLARILPLPFLGGHISYIVFLIFAVLSLIVSSLNPQSVSNLRMGVADAAAPVLKAVSAPIEEAASLVRDVSGIAALQAENNRLQDENGRLWEWYQRALLLEADNKSLRQLMRVSPDPQSRFVTAKILSDAGNKFVRSLIVMAGEDDGVRKGQAVLSAEGLVGRVVEVGSKTARILLIDDMNSRLPVVVEDSRQHAIMAGRNMQEPVLVHLPQDSDIVPGARIVTSGHGGIFQQGLPVGRVYGNRQDGYTVKLFADFDRLTYVKIIARPEDPNLQAADLP